MLRICRWSLQRMRVARTLPFGDRARITGYGKRRYGFDCVVCHGSEGDGKGDLAEV